MRICPKCRTDVADDVAWCPTDGRRTVTREAYDAAGQDPLLGATLDERYTLVGRVGAGGMGTVYRAEQSPLGREIALKVLRRELGRDPDTVARFTREAKLLSQLKHPNTVTILDFGQSPEGLLYLAMELLEGEMLSSRLRERGALDVEDAVRIASGVLRSLDEAHARGIIHRDLKPDNIFLARLHGPRNDDEIVKVVDFGIAKIRDGEYAPGLDPVATQEGTVFGTPRYMSPEQAQGKSLDGRSDLYAVGVLLFHMLTGQPPFTDDDAVIVMAHHIKTVPPPVGRLVPNRRVPAALEALVARALAKSPDDRPQTAQDFLAELDALTPVFEAARARSLLLTEETAIIPVPTPSRRPWLGAIGVAAVLFLAIGGFSYLQRRASLDAATQATARAQISQPLRDLPAAVEVPPMPEPSPEAPPPPPRSTTPDLHPAQPPSLATQADPVIPGARHVRRRVVGARNAVPVAPVIAPVAAPPPPRHRSTNQPYQTFEGM